MDDEEVERQIMDDQAQTEEDKGAKTREVPL